MMFMLEGLVFDHHGLGYLALWYGIGTLITGMVLLVIPKKLRRFSQYIRLIHLMTGLTAATFGIIAFLAAP